MDIVCLGEVLIDVFPSETGRRLTEVSSFQPKPGGAPANAAVAAARLGARSAFIGKVGQDSWGHFLEDVLKAEGVDTRGLRYDPDARTTLVFIAKPDENTAEFVFYRNPGADMLLRPEDLDESLLREARCLHFGSLSLIVEPSGSATLAAVEIAKQAGAMISFDVNYRPTLWQSSPDALERVKAMIPRVDLLKVNETELRILSGSEDLSEAAASLVALGPALCVVTLGPQGSHYQTRSGGKSMPPFQVQTVDAIGCGDAFIAGLLFQLVKDGRRLEDLSPERLERALRYANAVGALTATKLGVIPALPTAAQVEEFLLDPKGLLARNR
jgi:fructokinase